MRSKELLVLVLLMGAGLGCNKSSVFTGPKIYQLTDYRAGSISTYTYNSDGTIENIVQSSGPKTTFVYDNDTAWMNNYSISGSISSATEYFLNGNSANSVADSSKGQYTLTNNSASYTYDGNNQLTLQKNYVGNVLQSTYTYTNVNSNVNELVTRNGSGNIISYDYYNYLPGNSNTTGLQNKGYYYLGISTSNLVASDIKIGSALDTTDIITYHYYYNGSSEVDTMAYYNRQGALIDSFAYTYY